MVSRVGGGGDLWLVIEGLVVNVLMVVMMVVRCLMISTLVSYFFFVSKYFSFIFLFHLVFLLFLVDMSFTPYLYFLSSSSSSDLFPSVLAPFFFSPILF